MSDTEVDCLEMRFDVREISVGPLGSCGIRIIDSYHIANDVMTFSEWTAYQMMQRLEGWGYISNDSRTAHDAGNKIIALAEQIKSERAVIAMSQHG